MKKVDFDRILTKLHTVENGELLKQFKHAIDQSVGVAIIDQEGAILYVNDKFCEISKYARSELIGENMLLLRSHHHSQEFFANIWETVERGGVWSGEIFHRAKDDTIYCVVTTVVPFENDRYMVIQTDISKWKTHIYQMITEYSLDLIAVVDRDGKYKYVSKAHEKVLGYPVKELQTKNFFELIHDDDRKKVEEKFYEYQSCQLEFRMRDVHHHYLFMDATISAIRHEDCFVLVMRDITERKEQEAQIYHLAFHDPLTDLPNRRMFMKQLREEVALAKELNTKLAVMFLDLDRFKYVNDTWGHEAGDYILTVAAERLKKVLRHGDLIGRLGGDEFAIMLKNVNSEDDVVAFTNRLRESFKEPIEVVPNQQYSLSCSIGIAMFPDHGTDAEKLLLNADTALYAIKGEGKNEHAFFTREMEEKSLQQALLENELRKAIERDQFYIDYQPKIDFVQNKVVGMEALIRWRHPDLGIISPGQFIPLAEETGLISQIGEWVLRKACEQNKTWQDEGYPPLRISVNLSVKQLMEPNIVEKIKQILEETELEPKWLELEVTESVFANIEDAPRILKKIRDIGVHVSIDDFGTGYSSFSYIKHLPVDTLKIDSSFIRDIHENDESKAIVRAVLTLADTLGMEVLAEGIELDEQLKILNKDGCKLGQGFLFSKPLSKEKFERYIEEVAKEGKI